MSRAVPGFRRTLTGLACAALAAPLVLTAPAHASGTAARTVTPLRFTVPAGGRSCTVDADLYRPAGVDARHPAPAVLATNGFGGSKSDGTTDAIGRAFADRGYVALVYSGLGFGASGCLIALDAPDTDGRAASGLIDFLAGSRDADDGSHADYVTQDGPGDPRVGMIGGSYGGAVQLATAAVDHRVDAIVPMVTWNDLSYSLAPNNTGAGRGVSSDTPGVFKWQWTNGFYLMGEGQPLLVPRLDPSRFGSLSCLHFEVRVCEAVRLLNSGRLKDGSAADVIDYLRAVSPVSYLDRIETPTLLVQGQDDTLFNLNEATATYRALKARGTEVKMIWQAWGHSGGQVPGEWDLTEGNLDGSYVGGRVLAWFDRYLRHRTGTDTGPEFAYYRDWRSGYGTASEPPALTRTFRLSGDGGLVDSRAVAARGSRRYTNWPVPTSHSEFSLATLIGLSDPRPYDTPGTCLGWTSAPLTSPVDVVGAPRATLRVVSPRAERTRNSGDAADKLVLFAKVYDLAPNGSKTLVNRLVAPVRVPDPGKPFTVELPGIVHRYQAGHRLHFVLAASDTAYFGNRGATPVTVVNGPGGTGTLQLPVVGGATT
ncbi:CocE/NonD family hydrolase [Streptomyces sp. DT24]|uniref:CocE/NonD family hydrolase n=1 Tax=unclassified Streptomyces TaxID=2593676 RepID=UPI0023B930ED|nr:CocE/NonD family hydrolase [Streptomyces sp. AM 4-1-1]WEH36744.1 CocE/NonD family hydrolase [Streptomyces sp. AM 4-1-1]